MAILLNERDGGNMERPAGRVARVAETSVAHLRRRRGVEVEGCDVYIGRAMFQGGRRLFIILCGIEIWEASKWANPYRLCDFDDSRAAVLAANEKHVRASPELLDALHELEGKRLGCWCVEKRCLAYGKTRGAAACQHLDCHGDVLVKLLAERREKTGTVVPRRGTDRSPRSLRLATRRQKSAVSSMTTRYGSSSALPIKRH
jgi:hypothetical protein